MARNSDIITAPHHLPSETAQWTRHFEASCTLPATAAAVFAHLDDQSRLAAHMAKPSPMMGGGSMTYDLDAGRGMVVGSHIKMGGSAFGLTLFVDEVVIERDPPCRKRWRTVGVPRLLIIGGYEMGFELDPQPGGSRLRVWIEYALPRPFFARLLGLVFAGFYARWCVSRMVADASAAFPVTVT